MNSRAWLELHKYTLSYYAMSVSLVFINETICETQFAVKHCHTHNGQHSYSIPYPVYMVMDFVLQSMHSVPIVVVSVCLIYT